MTDTEDPSLTDSITLRVNRARDIGEYLLAESELDKLRWLRQALITTTELARRQQMRIL